MVINDNGQKISDDFSEADIPEEILIKEENIRTGGHYQAQSYELDVPASTGWVTKDISWPIPVSILSAEWVNRSEYNHDEAEFQIAPDTIIGTISVDVSVGTTEITVSSTVIDNAEVGYYIILTDGANSDDCGRIISIDSDNSKITVETATTNSFASATPTYVKQTVKMVPHMQLNANSRTQLGESKIGGSYIPANKILRLRYNNTDGVAKTFSFILEYLY